MPRIHKGWGWGRGGFHLPAWRFPNNSSKNCDMNPFRGLHLTISAKQSQPKPFCSLSFTLHILRLEGKHYPDCLQDGEALPTRDSSFFEAFATSQSNSSSKILSCFPQIAIQKWNCLWEYFLGGKEKWFRWSSRASWLCYSIDGLVWWGNIIRKPATRPDTHLSFSNTHSQ